MERMSRKLLAGVGAVIGAVTICACASTQPRAPLSDRGVLVLRLGPDTMFVERFEIAPGRIYVESVVRVPTTIFRTIDARLNGDGSLSSMRVASFDAANPRGAARDSATVLFSNDSTVYSLGIGSKKRFLRAPRRGDLVLSIPGNYWFPNYLLLAARAPRTVGDSLLGSMTNHFGADPLVVKRVAVDTVTVWTQLAGVMRVMLDSRGAATGLDGTGSSLGYIGTRVESIDIDSVSRAFAERERLAGPIGGLSLRDTVRAVIGGAQLTVDYGRPSKRNRVIFGNVVPWNRMWRTGANLATHLSTDRPLKFPGAVLPAGTYTLHTVPAPDTWTLLISSQTGQWGSSAPDPARIVARIPMYVGRLAHVAERFTITVEPHDSGGVIRLAWDDTFAEATFTAQ